MSIIRIKDKTFKTSITEAEIKARIKVLAQQINKDMEGKTPLFLGVLNGAFIFAADLMREMTIPCEISFVKLASYQGTTSTGPVGSPCHHRGGYRGEWSDDEAYDRVVRHAQSCFYPYLHALL